MTLLQHHVLALSLTAVTTFGLGLLVFLADPKRRLNQIFGLYSLAISWWALFESLAITASNQWMASIWAYVEWPGVIFIAPTFVHTVFLSIQEMGKSIKRVLRLTYVLSFVFLVFDLLFGFQLHSPRPVAYVPFFTRLSPLSFAIAFAFFILVNIGLWKLWHAYRVAAGHQRTQLKYLFWGSVIGYLGGSPDWFLVFGFYVPGLNPFGIYGVPCYSIATTYAVLHHKLFDVHLVIRKSLVYSLLVTVLTVSYFGLVYVVEHLFQLTFGYQSVWVSLAAFALMALAFQPLKVGIQRLVDWLLFKVPREELERRVERLEEEARQTEKLKAVATLAAGMAHEIKNPLASIKTFAEFLPQKYDESDFRDKFSRIVSQEVGKITALVQRLLEFAKPQPPQRVPVSVSKLIDETVEFLHGSLVKSHIEVARAYAVRDQALVDAAQLKQVFLNVLLNSIEAMDRPGCISISTVSANGHLEVLMADTGRGIGKKDLPHAFDPFFTTKRDGTGLGLSVVHSIVKEHGGRVLIESEVGRGTTVRIQLPIYGGPDG